MGAEDAAAVLSGHGKSVRCLAAHQSAAALLASAAVDPCVLLWDAAAGSASEPLARLPLAADAAHPPCDLAFAPAAALVATLTRDATLWLLDPRTGAHAAAARVAAHATGPPRLAWLGEAHASLLLTTGRASGGLAEARLWDVRRMAEPVTDIQLGLAGGAVMPLVEEDAGASVAHCCASRR